MTRILALVTFKVFPPQMGGQKGVVFFYQHLKEKTDVFLVVSNNNEAAPPGWDVQPFLFSNRKTYLNAFTILRLRKIIRQKKIEVIVAEHSYAAWLALLLKKTSGIPFVIHSHNIEALRFQQMGRRWWKGYLQYEKWIHQQADHSFFISKEDKEYAIKNFGLQPQKCSVATYGVEMPPPVELTKQQWLQSLGLKGAETIFYFNGTLDYNPNYDAVQGLINNLAPLLQQSLSHFKIIITGNRTPNHLIEQLNLNPHFLYLGFVADVQPFYQLTDVFVNAVQNSSGVKTKVIEALSAGCKVVSFKSGAAGIDASVCGNHLQVVADGDWQLFAQLAIENIGAKKEPLPKAFYDTYLWNNIAKQAALRLEEVARKYAY